ncbi:Na(+) H(+) antiporter subunit G [Leifsonia rubra CMS 76R]|nr:Na(+) H(+) antiporter subunit G [Leifsonia rubra CMS 76R]
MTTETIPDLIAAILLVLGGILTLAAGVGLVRFPDAPSRLHASTKPQVLGLVLVLIALALSARSWSMMLVLIPIFVFQMLTAPISAHFVARAAYRMGNFRKDLVFVDDLADAIASANAEPAADQAESTNPASDDS